MPLEIAGLLLVGFMFMLHLIDRRTRLRRPRRRRPPRVDPRRTWALEHELGLYTDHPPEKRLELLNHGPGCHRCSTIKPSLVGPAHLNGPVVERKRFSSTGPPSPGASLRACACGNITSNNTGVCGVCEMSLLAGSR